MMSSHSKLVEDLKSNKSAKKVSEKRQSVYSGLAANAGDNQAMGHSIDKRSVDSLAHEIDAYGATLEKDNSNKGGLINRKPSSSRRGESPLRAGANLQLSTDRKL